MGVIFANKNQFPKTKIQGCFFHLCQNVRRHIESTWLIKNYKYKSNFKQGGRMIMAMALIPASSLDSV